MAKPKTPRWLTEAFRDGVSKRYFEEHGEASMCWLAQHDPRQRPCSGPLERFHFLARQRVENALGALFPPRLLLAGGGIYPYSKAEIWELILLAAWDPRNGGIGCQHHHRRLDGHTTPELKVSLVSLPDHVLEFRNDWGLESAFEQRFPVHVELPDLPRPD